MTSFHGLVRKSFTSRILIVVIGIVTDFFIFDHSAAGVQFSTLESNSTIVRTLGSPFLKWDSVHNINIAMNGYVEEHSLAFYPGFPLAVHLLNRCLNFIYSSDEKYLLVISSCILNIISFCTSAVVLNKLLTKYNFLSVNSKSIAIVCFCYNPASIFFSASYTESLYTMLSWLGMSMLQADPQNYICAIPFFLASCIRSNGLFNCVFVFAQYVILTTQSQCSAQKCARDFLGLLLVVIAICYPHLLWNSFGRYLICQKYSYIWYEPSSVAHFHICDDRDIFHGLSVYTYVQSKYWNVGFLKYYEFKQIPNFMLAAPAISIAMHAIQSEIFDFVRRPLTVSPAPHCASSKWIRGRQTQSLPYAIHLLVVLVVGACFSHVQILTRLLFSSSPWMFVTCAELMQKTCRPYMLAYFGLFFLVGTVLHVNWYPWT